MDALKQAKAELAELVGQRRQLEERISVVAKAVDCLVALSEDKDYSSELPRELQAEVSEDKNGITEEIRNFVFSQFIPVTAPQVRDALKQGGFSEEDYPNLLNVVHNTLRRLEKQGEIVRNNSFAFGGVGGVGGWTRAIKHDP